MGKEYDVINEKEGITLINGVLTDSVGDTNAMILIDEKNEEKNIIVVFRGTETADRGAAIKDLISTFKPWKIEDPTMVKPVGQMHGGMADHFNRLKHVILPLLSKSHFIIVQNSTLSIRSSLTLFLPFIHPLPF